MEINYLQFRRPDGTRFNKLATIPQKQIDQYLADGCELIDDQEGLTRAEHPAPLRPPLRPASATKKRSSKKGGR